MACSALCTVYFFWPTLTPQCILLSLPLISLINLKPRYVLHVSGPVLCSLKQDPGKDPWEEHSTPDPGNRPDRVLGLEQGTRLRDFSFSVYAASSVDHWGNRKGQPSVRPADECSYLGNPHVCHVFPCFLLTLGYIYLSHLLISSSTLLSCLLPSLHMLSAPIRKNKEMEAENAGLIQAELNTRGYQRWGSRSGEGAERMVNGNWGAAGWAE